MVTVDWESAAGRLYRIQTSDDATTWTDRASYPLVTRTSGWLGIEDRVGFVVRGSDNPIEVSGSTVTLSAGPAAGSSGMVVEGHPSVRSAELSRIASDATAAAPVVEAAGVTASRLEGHLSLFNLTGAAVDTTVRLPAGTPLSRPTPGSRRWRRTRCWCASTSRHPRPSSCRAGPR